MGSKRGNREGSIYKTKDGRWRGTATVGFQNGKPKRKYVSGATRAVVAEKLTAAQRDRDRGLPAALERQTLGEFLDHWLESVARPSVRPSTYRSYAGHVRLYLKPSIGHIRLTLLTPQHVQQFMKELLQAGLSPTTVHHVRGTLRHALADAYRWDLVPRNVAALATPPPLRREKIMPLSPEQAQVLLDHIRGHRLEPLIVLALSTGLRLGEVLGLTWRDVDLDRGTLTVRNALQRVDGKLRLVPPKSKQSQRSLPLPGIVVDLLRRHKAEKDQDRALLVDRWDGRDFVFTTTLGTPFEGPNVCRMFKRLLASAGLPDQRFHDLRHACASFLLAQGVDMFTVKEILGHSQISLTIDTYGHLAPQLKTDAAARMDNLLSQGSRK